MASATLRSRPKAKLPAKASPTLQLKHAQGAIFLDRRRFRVLVCGRRFGKTFLALATICLGAAERVGQYYYVAPTYRMAEEIAWDMLQRIVPEPWIVKTNLTKLKVWLVNGSTIELKGSENPMSLRGNDWTGAVLDECAYIGDDVWEPVVRPLLATKQGWCLFTTTPPLHGVSGWFYDLFMKIKYPDAVEDGEAPFDPSVWGLHEYTSLDGENIPAEEIDAARREMDPRTFNIEYLGRFEALGGLVASCFSQENIRRVTDDPSQPLLIGMDFNNDPLTAVLAVIVEQKLHVFGELVLTGGATTWDMAEVLNSRFGLEREKHACPDPTGARHQTSGVGMSDHAILRRAGIKVFASKGWNSTKDKINAVNAAFKTADGVTHCHVDPSCKHLIKSCRTLGYVPGTDMPNKKSGVDHPFDAFGYLCLEKFNLNKKAQGGTGFRVW